MRRALLVDHLVDGQSPRLTEALLADAALEGLLVGVDESMVPEVILASKSLVTDITFEWSFVRVCPFVYEQVIGFSELSLAEATYEFLLWPS